MTINIFLHERAGNLEQKYDITHLIHEGNLVPRSLVDEAEGEIWQRKKISFS